MSDPRIIIAGSRDITDATLVCAWLDTWERELERASATVLCGGCRGVDTLGAVWARMSGYAVERYPADWKRHGRAAGPIRNEAMAKAATHCWVIRREDSRGSLDMLRRARKHGLIVREAVVS